MIVVISYVSLNTMKLNITNFLLHRFSHILENNSTNDSCKEEQLDHLIRITQLVRTDLQKAIEFHDRIFQQ
jgi:hypothetical protein